MARLHHDAAGGQVSFIDWTNVILPLAALIFGLYLVRRYSREIDRWVAQLRKR